MHWFPPHRTETTKLGFSGSLLEHYLVTVEFHHNYTLDALVGPARPSGAYERLKLHGGSKQHFRKSSVNIHNHCQSTKARGSGMNRGMINRPDLQGRNNQGFCRAGGMERGGLHRRGNSPVW